MSTVPIVPEEGVTQQPTAEVRPFRLGVPSVNVPEIVPGFKLKFGEAEFRLSEAIDTSQALAQRQQSIVDNLIKAEELLSLATVVSTTQLGTAQTLITASRRSDALKEELEEIKVEIKTQQAIFASANWRYDTLADYLPKALLSNEADRLITEEEILSLAPYTNRTNEDREFARKLVDDITRSSPDDRTSEVVRNLQSFSGNSAESRTSASVFSGEETLVDAIRRGMQFQHPTGITPEDTRNMLNNFFPNEVTEETLDATSQARDSAERMRQSDLRTSILGEVANDPDELQSKIRAALWRRALESPAIVALAPFEFWSKYVNKPLTGLAVAAFITSDTAEGLRRIGIVTPKEKQFMARYEAARDEGDINWWMAYGHAQENWGANGWLKFILEAGIDPLNAIGLGIFTKVLKAIPIIGNKLASINQGIGRVFELPFDGIKYGLAKILPKTVDNIANEYSQAAYDAFRPYIERTSGRVFEQVTPQDIQNVMIPAVKHAMTNPLATDDMATAGRQLLDYPAIGPNDLLDMAKTVPGLEYLSARVNNFPEGGLVNITPDLLSAINSGIEKAAKLSAVRWLQPDTLSVFLLKVLDTPASQTNLRAMVSWVNRRVAGIERRAIARLEGNNVTEITANIMREAGEDFRRAQNTLIANKRYQQGIYEGLGKIGGVAHSIWFNGIDAYFTRPFARAYLLFPGLPLFNVLEAAYKLKSAGLNAWRRAGLHNSAATEFFGLRGHVPLDISPASRANIMQQLPEDDFARIGAAQDLSDREIRRLRNSNGNVMDKIMAGRWMGRITKDITLEDVTGKSLGDQIMTTMKESYFVQMSRKIQIEGTVSFGDTPLPGVKKIEPQEEIVTSVVKFTESLTHDIGKHLDAEYIQGFRDELSASIRTGNKEFVRSLADRFTPGDVRASEVAKLLESEIHINPELKDLIIQKARTNELWSKGNSELNKMFDTTFREVLMEQHMHAPKLFKDGVDSVVNDIIAMEPRTIHELNMKMTMVDNMSEMYGDVVHISLEAAQLQGSRITNPNFKDKVFNQWWTERIVPHLVETEAQVDRLVTAMKDNLATSEVLAEMGTEQQQIYLQLLDKQLERVARIQTARLEQDVLRQDYFLPTGARYVSPTGAGRSANNGQFWDEFNRDQRRIFDQVIPDTAETERSMTRLGTQLPGYQVPSIVNTTNRALQPRDIAHIFGIDTNLLVNNMYLPELMAVRGKASFVSKILNKADEAAKASDTTADLMGFSKERVEGVYDRLVRDIKGSSNFIDSLQPGIIALENVRIELLWMGKRTGAMVSDEFVDWSKALLQGVDKVTPASTRRRTVEELTEAGGLGTVTDRGVAGDRLFEQSAEIQRRLTEVREEIARAPDSSRASGLRELEADIIRESNEFTSAHGQFLFDNDKPISIRDARRRITDLEASISDRVIIERPAVPPETEPRRVIQSDFGSERRYERDIRSVLARLRQMTDDTLDFNEAARLEEGLNIPLPENRLEAITVLEGELVTQEARVNSIRDRANTLQVAIDEEIASTIQRGIDAVGVEEITPEVITKLPARLDDFLDLGGTGLTSNDVANVNKTFTDEWISNNQDILAEVNLRYNKDFPDWNNQNAFNTFMKTIYPFWGYEAHRWQYLPREVLRHPGTYAAWGKYQDYTEQGYIHIPGTDIAGNILRGSMAMGGLRQLFMKDYPEFYDNFGGVAEVNDWLQRFGFYPGAAVGMAFALFGARSGASQLGEITPVWANSVINIIAVAFPDSAAVKIIQDRIFSNRWRDYLISIEVSKIGFNGTELLLKQYRGESLDEQEQHRWDEGRQGVAKYALWSELFGLTRMDPEEKRAFHRELAVVLNEMTGVPIEEIEDMRRNGIRLEDIAGGSLSPEIYQAVATISGWHRWSGAGIVLGPSEVGKHLNLRREYWGLIINYAEQQSDELLIIEQELSQLDDQGRALRTIDQWNEARVTKSRRVTEYINQLGETSRFKGIDTSLEGRTKFAEENGLPAIIENGLREMQEQWFNMTLTESFNDATGRMEPDFDKLFRQREAMEVGIGDKLDRFREFKRRNSTPLTIEHEEVSRTLFRPYNKLHDIVISQFIPEEQDIINRFNVAGEDEQDRLLEETTTLAGHEGDKVISTFNRLLSASRLNMRSVDPELDAWLVFFNNRMELQSEKGFERWRALRRQHGMTVSVAE